MRIGISELILIIIIALSLIKPDNLKEYAKYIGMALGKLKQEKDSIKNELNDIKEPIDDIINPINDIKKEMSDIVSDTININK